ncbi:type IV pilin protein [Pseudaeromonas sharmana]|uniref:Type IV pilin protein n=1 Tax=Pseudaeromonas sharmana TaxID=328412 RepID=A0ABV8CRP3_9GAMM
MHNKPCRGITLIELIIAVGVVAILGAIAYPSYLEHVKSTRRGEAKAALLELSQFMERKFSADGCYKCASETITLPFTQVPRDGGTKYYDLRLASSPAADSASYTLEAVPTGNMSGDSCGTFKLDQTATKTAAEAECW